MNSTEQLIYDAAVSFARKNKKQIAKHVIGANNFLPEKTPVSVFMAGSPGAGKTEASKALIDRLEAQVLRIDPDELRDQFEQYDGTNSRLFQGGISILVDKLHDEALKKGLSFILDGTLWNYERAKKNIERSLKKDRFVQILYVYQSPFRAWEFVRAREAEEGRGIPLVSFIDQYFAARETVNLLKVTFGQDIQVDLLLKDYSGGNRLFKAGVDQIDYHIPEKFTRVQLEAELSAN